MLALLALFACTSPTITDPAEAAPPAKAAPGAATCPLERGQDTLTLKVDGTTRKAMVRQGTKAGPKAPLLFLWHGFGSSPENMLPAVSAGTYWDDAIVVAPYGLGRTFEKFGTKARPG